MDNYEIDEIKFTDVIKKSDFWGWLVMGTGLGWLAISMIWSVFRLITGNDPAWDYIDKDTGNFIVFLAFIIAAFKSYNSIYNSLYNERQRQVEEMKEWNK